MDHLSAEIFRPFSGKRFSQNSFRLVRNLNKYWFPVAKMSTLDVREHVKLFIWSIRNQYTMVHTMKWRSIAYGVWRLRQLCVSRTQCVACYINNRSNSIALSSLTLFFAHSSSGSRILHNCEIQNWKNLCLSICVNRANRIKYHRHFSLPKKYS